MDQDRKTVTTTFDLPSDADLSVNVRPRRYYDKPYFRLFSSEYFDLVNDRDLKLDDFRVLGGILATMDFDNLLSVSQEVLADSLGMQRSAVGRSVKKLITKGYLQICGSVGRQNVYRVSLQLAHKGRGKNYRYLQTCWMVDEAAPAVPKMGVVEVDVQTFERPRTSIEELSKRFDIPLGKLEKLFSSFGEVQQELNSYSVEE